MSHGNAEVVRRMYEAFNRGDQAGASKALHPEAQLHQPPNVADTDSYYGRDEFARGLETWLSEFDEPRFEPEEIRETGDCVIMRVRVSGRGKTSGAETSAEFFHAWTMSDGKPHKCFVRSTRAEAVKAVGLDE